MTVWLVCLTIGMACYYVVVGLLLRAERLQGLKNIVVSL